MKWRWCIPLLAVGVLLAGRPAPAQPADDAMEGHFWRQQGLRTILPAWTQHARDEQHGAFFAHLSRDWTPETDARKYPGMISRHVFSYAAAYLMSGKEEHLRQATSAVDYMIAHGWDDQYGGWYNALSREGAVADSSKDLFMQIYAVTGLALYYIATREERALNYVERTRRLLREHAWDEQAGGYVRSLRRDLSVKTSYKDFSPQLAPLSGYLMYLYPATNNEAYLQQAERIMQLVLEHMHDEETGWILERFERSWQPRPDDPKNSHINVGHNVETAWLLLRLYQMTEKPRYRRVALALSDSLLQYAFDAERGVWKHRLKPNEPTEHPDTTPWWVQAYGNMLQLYLYRVTGERKYLRHFRAGARFWNQHFVDEEEGGTVLSTYLDGRVERGAKAVRTKTSYHAMEHALLNYLYLRLWREQAPATLHFRIDGPGGGLLRPWPIAAAGLEIQQAHVNGEAWSNLTPRRKAVRLPADGPSRVRVTLAPKQASADSLFDLVIYGRGFEEGAYRVFLRTNPSYGETWQAVGTVPDRGADEEAWRALVLHGIPIERYLGQDFRENYLAVKMTTRRSGAEAQVSAVYAMPHVSGSRGELAERVAQRIAKQPGRVRRHSLASYVRPRPVGVRQGTPFVEKVEAPVRYEKPGEAEVAWLELLFGN